MQVSQASPYPFKRPETEIPHPDMTEDNLEQPYTDYYIIGFVSLQFAVQPEPIKNNGGNDRLHEVISKSHLPYRYKNAEK